MKNKMIWQFVDGHLSSDIPVMLMTVVDSYGASPGKAGFRMAIAADGHRLGTIGGGVMEVKWVEQSLKLLSDGSRSSMIRKLFHSRETAHEQSGLICSGSQTILITPIYKESKSIISEIVRTFDEHHVGGLQMSAEGFAFHPQQRYTSDRTFFYRDESDWMYEENIGVVDTIYIVGSGHVGLALSRIMSTLDFRVVVFDDRADVETFTNNTFAHQKINSNYSDIGSYIAGNAHEYVAVVTTAYKSDEAALKSVLKKEVRYIGLMGSAAKTKQIADDLKLLGISEEKFSRVHNPIGLQIASHTPEEIAISIAAEIIKERNGSTRN